MNDITSMNGGTSPAPGQEPVLVARGLSKSYRDGSREKAVFAGVDIVIRRGSFVCVVGPSGAGKTTLLRCLAGLQQPTSGTLLLDGQPISGPPENVAVVFQDYGRSLMPWLSVNSNVELPLRSKGLPKPERMRRTGEALKAVGLADQGQRYPWQLSGGMQQRVAIARALAYEPEALLMDEPFASVDAQTRADLEDLMLRVRARYGMTIVLVTHDIDEAIYLSDEVVVLSGSPSGVRERLAVNLGPSRDQIRTKSTSEFSALRAHALTLIRENAQVLG